MTFFSYLFLGLSIFIFDCAQANFQPYQAGVAIVRFKKKPASLKSAQTALTQIGGYQIVEPIIPELGIYKVRLPQKSTLEISIRKLSANASIQYAQKNHLIEMRAAPNDTDFGKQWSMLNKVTGADTRATQAWELGTGGKDASGNEIVVAMVDGGIDLIHKDLAGNIWVNQKEIPANGIDDDGNGYIDDVNGWNAFGNNGQIPIATHGTHVAGIIGASGNNSLQVAGINWSVKIMTVAGASGDTATVQKAYGYVLKMKKLWLESHGKLGANIVATNSSFGVNQGKCDQGDFPIWNDLYNEMGKVGILSAAATANAEWNIDEVGDVPTGCNSPFLINITNTNESDGKANGAGFGIRTIHLGAPGTAIVSTLPGNSTGPMTGTSMSTPHVAGTIALLHSIANPTLNKLYLDNPEEGARIIRNAILRGVDVLPTLQNLVSSGGRLNIRKAAEYVKNYKATQ